jgi:hypothetical protein
MEDDDEGITFVGTCCWPIFFAEMCSRINDYAQLSQFKNDRATAMAQATSRIDAFVAFGKKNFQRSMEGFV